MIDYGAIPMTTSGAGPLDLVTTAHRLFKETRAENGIAGDGFPFAVQRYVFVTEDRAAAETAAEQILVHARMAANMRRSTPEMTGSDLDIVPFEGEPTLAQIFERAIIGDAEAVTERILAGAEAHGMTHLSAFMQFAGLPYDLALRSLELFCDRVVPAVRKGKGPGKRALAS
jgi:alkanesulfonate monooxygenase SsuD/methylene tetrahydromethanopterin reductase-like flavin-dependent oxidoreductase (luciferase family)